MAVDEPKFAELEDALTFQINAALLPSDDEHPTTYDIDYHTPEITPRQPKTELLKRVSLGHEAEIDQWVFLRKMTSVYTLLTRGPLVGFQSSLGASRQLTLLCCGCVKLGIRGTDICH